MRLGLQYAVVVTKVANGSLNRKGDVLRTSKTRKDLDTTYIPEGVTAKVQKINVSLAE